MVRLVETIQVGLGALLGGFPPGGRVAVAVGSRGISDLPEIVRAVVDLLKARGFVPFIVPAMGSHGGATPEGQSGILATYGITPEAMGVEIDASMATTLVGQTANAVDIHVSRAALSAQAVILINRVKPHTDFGGPVGSGLLKMLAVGLGKREGAVTFHAAASRSEPGAIIKDLAEGVRRALPLLAGVALVEDQRHQIALLEVVASEHFAAAEARLLQEAARRMPRLPFDDIDLLIVDCIGKNISGTGMDPNVINRSVEGYSASLHRHHGPPPRIRRLFVRDLTPESRGNAIGIGLADFTTTRLVRAMDIQATALNALTALNVQGAKVPIHFETDAECLRHALASLALTDPAAVRIVRIRDTLSLETLEASEALLDEVRRAAGLSILNEPSAMVLDEAGNLL